MIKTYPKKNGFILIEFILYLSLATILIGTSSLFLNQNIKTISATNDYVSIYSQLQLARLQAQALDQDVILSKKGDTLLTLSNEYPLTSYILLTDIEFLNNDILGFTGNGTTKKSGKIKINFDDKSEFITLGIWDAPIKL